jgi:hypothetical protein
MCELYKFFRKLCNVILLVTFYLFIMIYLLFPKEIFSGYKHSKYLQRESPSVIK